MNDEAIERARRQLESAQHILITSHIRPDGDAIGSVLGLGLALQAAGKQVQMVLPDSVPATFQHLEGVDQVRSRPDGKAELVVFLDISDPGRVGEIWGEDLVPDLNVDHHVTNLNFAAVNLVDTQAVATAAILADCLPRWGLSVSQSVAAALLTGIITDTLGFRTSNMNSRALRIAADLMDIGIDLPDLYDRALVQRSFEAARYWGAGLARLQRQGHVVWTSFSASDRQESGYPGHNDADLVNFLSTIRDSDVALIFVEQPGGNVKVSWRSRPHLDISQIAVEFGGGGHSSAAGAELSGDLESVKNAVLEATQALISAQERQEV